MKSPYRMNLLMSAIAFAFSPLAMAEADASTAGEAATAAAAKKKTEYIKVKMSDDREVDFPKETKAKKELLQDEAGNFTGVRFDFSNGTTKTVLLANLGGLTARLAVHGLSQKLGDSYASEKDVADAVLAFEDTHDTLAKGEWSEGREGGFGGQSVLLQACMEQFKQTAEQIKTVLKTMTPKEKQQLRQADGIREIIQRLETEKAKANPVDIAALQAKFTQPAAA